MRYPIPAGPLAVAVGLAFALLATGCRPAAGPKDDGKARAEARLRATPIHAVRKTLIRYCEQPGQVVAREQTPLHAKVDGYVREIHVDIGDVVRGPVREAGKPDQPGQLLVKLEVPELENELARREAGVRQAESEITQSEAAIRVAQAMSDSAAALVEEAQASTERVDGEYERWRLELARMTELAARQAVTEKVVDETRSKYQSAEAACKEVSAKIKSARANVKETLARIAKAEADLGAAQARLEVAQAERDRLKTLLAFSEIRAPFDGIVAARHADVGHLVTAGSSATELLVIVNAGAVRVLVDVPEIDAVQIAPDAAATVLATGMASRFEGHVTRTTWVLNQATRTLRVEIDIQNQDGRLRPGMYAHARLKVAERPETLVLPKSALMTTGGQSSCWRIEADGTLRRQLVQTGIEAGGEVEIVAGVTDDEAVIGVNVAAFREGQQVEAVSP